MTEPHINNPPGTIVQEAASQNAPSVEGTVNQNAPVSVGDQPTVRRDPPPRSLPEIPGYEIEKELGRGGMGVVYLARQVRANRRVALKTILPQASDEDRRRFVLEAQAIAEIDHPNIIKVYDVAEYDGRPYFAMEFCPGGSLSGILDGTPWAPRPAAELLVKLARGMEAAHLKGIIHRDLKPANVLLVRESGMGNRESGNSTKTGTGQEGSTSRFPIPDSRFPKITDFGLAKRLDSDDGNTRTGAIMGTPSYMAPEQALGDVSKFGPATDVYALGVLFYELLAGHPPFKGATMWDTLDQVRNSEAVSVRFLNPQTPKDLDTVCIKCLRKDPQKRYPDAGALAADLDRWLGGRPIEARPVDWLERTLKWVNRNRGVAAGLIVGFAALLIGTVIALWQWREAVDALGREREARRQADTLSEQNAKLFEDQKALTEKESQARKQAAEDALEAGQVTDFLAGMFNSANPLDIFGSNVLPPNWEAEQKLTARDFLDRAAERAKTGLKEVPLARAKLLSTIGSSYRNLGLFAQADPLLEEAYQLRLKNLPENHPDLGQSHFERGGFYHDFGDLGRAEKEFRAALKVQEAAGASEEEQVKTLFYIGSCLGMAGDPGAKKHFVDLIERAERTLGKYHRLSLLSHGYLVAVMIDRHEEQDPLFVKTNLEFLEIIDGQPSDQAKLLGQIAREFQAAMIAQKASEAVEYDFARRPLQQKAIEKFTEALKLCQAGLPPDNGFACLVRFEYGHALEHQGNLAGAEKQYQQVVNSVRRSVGFCHPRTLVLVQQYADFLGKNKRPDEARSLFREAEESNRRGFGEESLWRGYLMTLEAAFEFEHGERPRGISLARQVCDLAEKGRIVATVHSIHDLYDLAEWFPNVDGPDREIGVRLLDHARRLMVPVLGESDWHAVSIPRLRSFILRRMGRWEEQEKSIAEAAANVSKVPGLHPYQIMTVEMELAFSEFARSRFGEAERHFAEARRIARKEYADKSSHRRDAALNLMLPLMAQGKYRDALLLAIEAEKERDGTWTDPRARYRWDRRAALLQLNLGNPVPLRALIVRLEKDLRAAPNQQNLSILAEVQSLLPGDCTPERWKAIFALGPKERVTLKSEEIPGYCFANAGRGDFVQALRLRRNRFDGDPLDEEILALRSLAEGDFSEARRHLDIAVDQAASLSPKSGTILTWNLDDYFDRMEAEIRRAGIDLAIRRMGTVPERIGPPKDR